MIESLDALPVTILTGFLGSGKTTLLNHILHNQVGVRTAVLVNEFGEIGIDNELIIATDNNMVELSNGCICCSINQDLVKTIAKILERRDRLDYLLVETTGLADPLPIALTFVGRDLSKHIRLDSIITLVDAENYSPDLFESPAAYNQIRYGDIILLNKTDLVRETTLDDLEVKIQAIKDGARILRTTHARVPLPLLLGGALFKPLALPQSSVVEPHSHTHKHHAPANSSDIEGFTSLSFESDRPLDMYQFQDFLGNQLPIHAFRAKGILWFAGREPRYVFHLCGRRCTLDETAWEDRPRKNQLVIIGQDFDHDRLRAQLQHCLEVSEPSPC